MSLIVQKFGGTSVATSEHIRRVAARIATTHRAGHGVLAVVSAMGSMTDELADLAHRVNPAPPAREMDMLLTAGERISMALLAMALDIEGVEAISLTGSQAGILTVGGHGSAEIQEVRSFRVQEGLDRGKVVIVAGFQGVDPGSKEVTTLGRGGSDVSAVALAGAHSAEVCEIYKDVDGVFTADPRLVDEARLLDRLSYEEMLALAACGSGVVMSRAVETAIRYGVPLHVRSSFHDRPGTRIGPDGSAGRLVCGVAHQPGVAVVTSTGRGPGPGKDLFGMMASAGVWVDFGPDEVQKTFAIPETHLEEVLAVPGGAGWALQAERGLGRVSVVGLGIPQHFRLVEDGRDALKDAGIRVALEVIASNRLSFYVDGNDLSESVRVLHRSYDPPLLAADGR